MLITRSKYKKALTKIVKGRIDAHPHQHRHIFLNICRLSSQDLYGKRFCKPVGQQIANHHIGRKPDNLFPGMFMIPESKIFIQKD